MLALEHAEGRDEKIKHHLRTLDTLHNVLQASSPELRVQGSGFKEFRSSGLREGLGLRAECLEA